MIFGHSAAIDESQLEVIFDDFFVTFSGYFSYNLAELVFKWSKYVSLLI